MFLRGSKRKLIMNRFIGILVNCVCILIMYSISLVFIVRTEARVHTPPQHMLQMDRDLETIPQGTVEIELLNVGYNQIEDLPEYVFWNNSFKNAKKIILTDNCIRTVNVHAFKGLKHLKFVDLSTNNLTTLDPYTFKSNHKLEKLVLLDNSISFHRVQTFLVSHSLETLVLSNNKITDIYDTTFLGVPNVRDLILSDNELNSISQHSFRQLSQLQYLSLANTGVYRLGESMFRQIPRMLNLEGTPLAESFVPPLKQVKDEAVEILLRLNNQKFGS